MSRGIAIFLALVAIGPVPAQAALIPVEPMQSTITVRCGGDAPSTRTTTHTISTGQCDTLTQTFHNLAVAEAYLVDNLVVVRAFASVITGATSAEATSTINIKLRANQNQPPPMPVSTIDVGAILSAAVQLSGGGIGTASATLTGPLHGGGTVLAIAPPDFADRSVSVQVEPDQIYDVALRATCFSVASGSIPFSDCQAAIDPQVFFDQAAFDARLGVDTFLLSDYYSLEISTIVPIPPAVWLFGSGLIGLIGIARRKKAA